MVMDDCVLSNQDNKEWENFADGLNEEYPVDTKNGNILKGKIVKITDKVAIGIDGYKSEKYINIEEIQDSIGNLVFKEGDEIELLVNGNYISYKQAMKKKRQIEYIEKINKEDFINKIIDVKVINKNKGGYIVNWNYDGNDIECFMPYNVAAIKKEAALPTKNIKVCISQINKDNINVSRKKYFDINKKNREENLEKILSSIEPLKGEVVSITNFGIFVSINGIEGLVHSSEISHKNFIDPNKIYKIGDNVLVKVLSYNKEKSKLLLSIKALSKSPWENINNELKIGYIVKAVVSSIQPYGAFVDIGNDIEGFLHITELTWDKEIKNHQNIIKVGQEIDVKIIELDASKKRLRVSLKQLSDKPFDIFTKQYKEGDILNGKVVTLTNFGAFIRFNNVDGLLHNEDYSWDKNSKCIGNLKIGDEIKVKILKINKEEAKISVSRKLLLESPVEIFSKSHKIDSAVSGKVVEIKDFGIFVNICENIDALIRNEDIFPMKKEDIHINDIIEANIVNIDTKNNKIRLSIKRFIKIKENEEVKNYNNNEKMTLGDRIKK